MICCDRIGAINERALHTSGHHGAIGVSYQSVGLPCGSLHVIFHCRLYPLERLVMFGATIWFPDEFSIFDGEVWSDDDTHVVTLKTLARVNASHFMNGIRSNHPV